MILKLPMVTLMGIDSFTPLKTLRAMEFSTRFVDFGDAILLTDTNREDIETGRGFRRNDWAGDGGNREEVHKGWRVDHLNVLGRGTDRNLIRLVHHTETTEKVARPQAPHHPPLPKDYERAVMVEPEKHVQTDYVLSMEWDSAVLNPLAWTDEFLKYDFIGAPWSRHHEPGWPVCDETNNVGNGGFSLKSMKFCRAIAEAVRTFPNDPGIISSDMWPCRTMRPWLEARGIRFAPAELAMQFSCENMIYTGAFGFHGRWTAEMNNWGGDFLGSIRPK